VLLDQKLCLLTRNRRTDQRSIALDDVYVVVVLNSSLTADTPVGCFVVANQQRRGIAGEEFTGVVTKDDRSALSASALRSALYALYFILFRK
jgi:hypothetical protein